MVPLRVVAPARGLGVEADDGLGEAVVGVGGGGEDVVEESTQFFAASEAELAQGQNRQLKNQNGMTGGIFAYARRKWRDTACLQRLKTISSFDLWSSPTLGFSCRNRPIVADSG